MPLLAFFAALALAAPSEPLTQTDLDCLYDASCRAQAAPAVLAAPGAKPSLAVSSAETPVRPAPPAPRPARVPPSGLWNGLKNGAAFGGMLSAGGVLSPAIHLLAEGWGREYSRGYDGPRRGNRFGPLFMAAGFILAAALYLPAMAVGAVGALVGAAAGTVSEAAAPGSTNDWDAEDVLFD